MPKSHPEIAYVELYVADEITVLDYYTRGLWFDQVAYTQQRKSRSTLLRSNRAQVIVTTPTDTDGPVADYLARHGDGVADIALHHPDLNELVHRSYLAGLEVLAPIQSHSTRGPLTAQIMGAGSVRHTLLSTTTHLVGRLPPGFDWATEHVTFPMPAEARTASIRPQAIDHVAWCLPPESLNTVSAQYREAFALPLQNDQIEANATLTNCHTLSTPGLTFVLMAPDQSGQPRSNSHVDNFLEAHGTAGVQHLAYRTNDILRAVPLHARRNVDFLTAPDAYYDQLPTALTGRLKVRARWEELRSTGVLIDHDGAQGLIHQISARSPHQRGALSYELVQRDGPTEAFSRGHACVLSQTPGTTTRT